MEGAGEIGWQNSYRNHLPNESIEYDKWNDWLNVELVTVLFIFQAGLALVSKRITMEDGFDHVRMAQHFEDQVRRGKSVEQNGAAWCSINKRKKVKYEREWTWSMKSVSMSEWKDCYLD